MTKPAPGVAGAATSVKRAEPGEDEPAVGVGGELDQVPAVQAEADGPVDGERDNVRRDAAAGRTLPSGRLHWLGPYRVRR